MLRYLLVLLIGALLGANVAWYAARARQAPCATQVPPAAMQSSVPPSTSTFPNPAPDPGSTRGTVPVGPAAPVPAFASGTSQRTSSGLSIPVDGIRPSQLVDTFTQARSEGRVHEAIDIMAPAGTPVIAAVDGPVAKLFNSARGGLTIYQFDAEGRRVYYYAHLQAYAAGLAEGQTLRQGQQIGLVGSTGDASPTAPHLHFSVGDLGPDKKWWQSTTVNPYPLLAR